MKVAAGWLSVWWRRATWVFAFVTYIYLATYAILMEPRMPVMIDSTTGRATTFYSCYRFAPCVESHPPHTLTILIPTTTWLNRVFYPIDMIRNMILPKSPRSLVPTVDEELEWE